jgi:ATP-dependent exoDNAse (exonuclease V) beta subunit
MIADLAERERALDPARSFIVQAPAGSGKTSLLVERYLALLGVVAQAEEILAITFTRKAAAEMRKRVLGKLSARAAMPLEPGEVAHRLRIMTIDAFCASLTRQMPVLAKFGAQPGIVEDAAGLYREAALATLADLETPGVARLLAHLDNNVETAATNLAAMLRKRDQWLRKTGQAPTRAELQAAFAAERERLIGKARALDPRASENFAREVLTQKGEWRKRSKDAKELSTNESLRVALAALLSLPPPGYSDAQWEALEAMLALLPVAAAQLKVVFAARGQADFTEFAQGAVRALGSPDAPTDLLLSLDHRIKHLLVDEFQDTSISQWELLERLTAGWQPDDGRTLFVVGDPMQSIYRFREAEVALFLKARHEGLPNVKLEPLSLKTNFRSHAGLVEWVNASFAKILPAGEDESSGAVPYSPATPHPDNVARSGIAAQWHAPADRDDEARRIVDLVKAAEGDCAILVRKRSALAGIVPALKAAGIRFRAIEIETLGEKQVVQDLFALARALSHLGDRVAWLAILRAPWCGLELSDLAALAEGARERCIWELMNDDRVVCNLSEEGRKRLLRLWEPIGQAIIHRLRGTLRDRVEGVWLTLGGPACVEDPTELEDAEAFLDALEEQEEAGEVDLERVAETLEKLYALPDLAAGEHDLQIMTIHKAKGLEFGTVIVPGLEQGPGRGEPPLLLWKEMTDRSLLLAPIKESGGEKEPAYEYLKALEREAEDTEAGRLLYVAATRAKHRLHLLACPKKTMPPKRSLLACAWPVARSVYEGLVPPEEESSVASAEPMPYTLKRLPADWKLPPVPPAAECKTSLYAASEKTPIEFSWAGETARHVGTVVHRWLQRIADDELKGWDARRVETLRVQFGKDLERRGVPFSELSAAVGLVAAALQNTLADERGRWLLGPHAQARSEHRLRTADGTTYVVDRVFLDEFGERWVADWKTGRHEGRGLEAFLANERARYAPQLERYAALLGARRFGLYFPLAGGLLDCSPADK